MVSRTLTAAAKRKSADRQLIGRGAGAWGELAIGTSDGRRHPAGGPAGLIAWSASRSREAAYGAICATLPVGSAAVEAEANERGERLIWHEAAMVDRPGAMRGLSETYSAVILRLAVERGLPKPISVLTALAPVATP